MSHLDHVRPSGVYSGEMVMTAADWQRFDVAQSKTINGDAGGAWSPTQPIRIGGAGITFTTAPTEFSGGITTQTGGRVELANVSGNVPTISAPQSRTILISCADLISPIATFSPTQSMLQDDYDVMSTSPLPVGLQSTNGSTLTGVPSVLYVPSRYLHQGGSLSNLKLHFRVTSKPTTNTLPSLGFGMLAVNASGSFQNFAPTFSNWQSGHGYSVGQYVVPSATPTNYINGYYYKCTIPGTSDSNAAIFNGVTTIGQTVSDTDGVQWTCMGLSGELSQFGLDAASYYNNGQPQTLEYDYDNATSALLARNQVDHTTYGYALVVGGIGDASQLQAAVNIVLHSVELTFANIVDMRFA